MVQKYKLLVGNGKDQVAQTIDIEQGTGNQTQPVMVKAQAGMRYQLAQANTPKAPHNVRAKRVGKDLQVFLEDSQQANLVIQNYYDETPTGVNALVGQAENGSVYSYIPEDANAAGLIPNLTDGGNLVGMALGSYEEFMLAAVPLVAAGTGGVGMGALAAGLGLAALAGGGGGGGAAATDTTAPTGQTGALAAASDTGTQGDNLTSNKTPTITGKAEAGAKVEVTINGKTYTTTADANGNYSVNVTDTLPDGAYTPEVKVTDAAGNASTATGTPFTIDTATAVTLAAVTTSTLNGTGEAGAQVTVKDPTGVVVGTITVAADGTWTLPNTTGAIGTYSATATDKAGNSNTASQSLATRVVTAAPDTTAPTGQTGALAAASDSGTAGDNLTSVKTLTITGKAETGAKVEVTINGKTYTTTADANGNYSVNVTDTLPDGAYTPQIKVTDAAGNASTVAGTAFTVDTNAPAGQTGALAAASDTGIQGDNLTSNKTPTLTGKTEAGAKVEVTINGKTYTTTADASGNYSVSIPASDALQNGSYAPQIKVTDAAGNVSTATGTPFTIDTNTVVTMAAVTATTLSGIGEAGAQVIVKDPTGRVIGTATVATDGTWTMPNTTGAMGTYTATATDKAGNNATTSGVYNVVTLVSPAVSISNAANNTNSGLINAAEKSLGVSADVALPASQYKVGDVITLTLTDAKGAASSYTHTVAAADLTAGKWSVPLDSTNLSTDGNYTTATTVARTGATTSAPTNVNFTVDTTIQPITIDPLNKANPNAVTGTAGPGDKVTVQLPDGTTKTTTADASGKWSVTPDTLPQPAGKVVAVSEDPAGNTSNTNQDRSSPLASETLAISGIDADTGTSAIDFITQDNASDGKLNINGVSSAADGTKVAVKLDGVTVGTTTVVGGKWSFDYLSTSITGGKIADDKYALSAALVDSAGKEATQSISKDLVIDTSATLDPSLGKDPVTGALKTDPLASKTVTFTTISDDTGVSSTDKITADHLLAINGTSDAADGTVIAVNVVGPNGTLQLGKAIVSGGKWSLDATATSLPDASYKLNANILDVAGNVVKTVSDTLVIDSSSATGPGNVSNPTAPANPITDPNGTNSGATKTLAIAAISTDTETVGDFKTTDNTLVISGTSNATTGAYVAVSLGGSLIGYAAVKADGSWSFDNTDTTLPVGNYTLDATLVDKAGNTIAKAKQEALQIQPLSGDPQIVSISTDNGVSPNDFVTNDQSLIINGTSTSPAGSRIDVFLDGVNIGQTTVLADKTWVLDYQKTNIAFGNHTLTASVINPNGSTYSTSGNQALVIDNSTTQNPGLPAAVTDPNTGKIISSLAISDDTGTSAADFITNDTTLVLSGKTDAADGSDIAISFGGTLVGYAKVVAGSFSYSGLSAKPDGVYVYTAAIVDKAGNALAGGSKTENVQIDTSTTKDAQGNIDPLASKAIVISKIDTDSGISGTDFITSDNASDGKLLIAGTAGTSANPVADGTVVQIKLDDKVIGTTTVSAGTWSINYTGSTLADGNHTLDASILDTVGNEASQATQQALVIDTSATLTPTGSSDTQLQGKTIAIGSITDDTGVSGSDYITQDNKLVFTGTSTATDGANVAVKLNGAVIGYTTVTGGKWSYNYTSTTLLDGAYKIDASLVDAPGNEAGKATQQVLLIDTSSTVNPDPAVNPGTTLVTDPNAGKTINITAITDDTGTAGDFKTTDSNLVISGISTAAVGSIVDIKVDSVHVGYASVQTGGTWSFDYSGTTLALGPHNLDASIVDVAGNVVVTASQKPLEILAATPLKNNTVSINGITNDTGSNGADFITSDPALVFNGKSNAAANTAVVIKVDGKEVGVTTVDASGNWVFDYSTTSLTPQATYKVSAVLRDTNGLEGAQADQNVTIDTSDSLLPNGPNNPSTDPLTQAGITITAISPDTGTAGDYVTSAQYVTFSGTSTAPAGTSIRVTVKDANNAVVIDRYTTVDTNGAWSLVNTSTAMPTGKYTLDAAIADAAGNLVVKAIPQTVEIILPPVINGEAVAITAISQDTGVSSSDFYTADNNGLTYTGTAMKSGVAMANQLVDVFLTDASGTQFKLGQATTNASGVWTLADITQAKTDGIYTIGAKLIDRAGNVLATSTQALTIDTNGDVNPGKPNPLNDPSLNKTVSIGAVSKDTGVSSNDFVTADNGADTTNSDAALADGKITLSGSTTAVISGGNSIKVQLLDSTGKVVSDGNGTGEFYATIITGSNGVNTWSINFVPGAGKTIADGVYTVHADIVDKAGNTLHTAGATTTQKLVIDTSSINTVDPIADVDPLIGNTKAVAITSISQDTGVSASDFITADNAGTVTADKNGKLTINGTTDAANGATVAVKVDGNIVGYATVAAGAWSFDYTPANGAVIADGVHKLDASVVDLAGNVKVTATKPLTIDTNGTVNPTEPNPSNEIDPSSGKVLDITSITQDTGVPNDFYTWDRNLVFGGTTTAPVGALVAVKLDGAILGYATVVAGGNGLNTWSFDNQASTLPAGNYVLSAAIVDKAGNVVVNATQSVTITIDPNAPTATLNIESMTQDTGTADFVTTNGSAGRTVVVAVGTPLASTEWVEVNINGVWTKATLNSSTGKWEVKDTQAHTADWTYDARIIDLAGNVGNTDSQVVTLGTAPSQTIAITSLSTDSGVQGDWITNDGSANGVAGGTLSAPLTATQKVQVSYDNGLTWVDANTTTSNGVTTWAAIDKSTHNANWTIQAKVVDISGATSALASQNVTWDNTAYSGALTLNAIDDNVTPQPDGSTGTYTYTATGSITNDTSPLVKGTVGTLAADELVHVFRDGVDIGIAAVAGGNWIFQDGMGATGSLTAPLNNGSTYTYTAKVIDGAGNPSSPTAGFAISIDTTTAVLAADVATATEASTIATGSTAANFGSNPTGNLLSNDTVSTKALLTTVQGAGGAISIASGSTSVNNPTEIVGAHGTLKVGADGSYAYFVNNADAAVNALSAGGSTLTDTFTYAVNTLTGGVKSSTLNVTINGASDAQTTFGYIGGVPYITHVELIPDFDGDGRPDLIFDARYQAPSVYVLSSRDFTSADLGGGTLDGKISTAYLNGQQPNSFIVDLVNSTDSGVQATGDVDGDGLSDFIMTYHNPGGANNVAQYFLSSKDIGAVLSRPAHRISENAFSSLPHSYAFGTGDNWHGSPFFTNLTNTSPGKEVVLVNTFDAWLVSQSNFEAMDLADGTNDNIASDRTKFNATAPGGISYYWHIHKDTPNGADRSVGNISDGGDLDGDGLSELLMYDPYSTYNAGDAAFYLLNTKDLPQLAALNGGSTDTVNLSTTNLGTNSYEFRGITLTGSNNRISMSKAGDVNGDGKGDILMTSSNDSSFWLVSSSDLETLDNADGVNDNSIQLSNVYKGPTSYQFKTATGLIVGDSVGDVDGDGLGDLLLINNTTGNYYLVLGKDLAAMDVNHNHQINLDTSWNAAGTSGYKITTQVGGLDVTGVATDSGFNVTSYADLDGDGKSDFVVAQGAYQLRTFLSSQLASRDAADGTVDRSFFYDSGAVAGVPSVNTDILGTSGNDVLSGGSDNNVIKGNGGADIVYAGAGDDTIVLNASNIAALSAKGAYVDGGTGTDTIVLDGSGITFDFTALQSKVMGIEKIDLTGSGNNTLKLSLADVIAVSDTHNLYVTGNTGDSVQVKGTSVTPTATTVSGVAYNDYNLDGIHHLYVQQAVTAVFVA